LRALWLAGGFGRGAWCVLSRPASKTVENLTIFDGCVVENSASMVLGGLACGLLSVGVLSQQSGEPMSELAWHLMLRTDDDRVIAPSAEKRRCLARTVYRVAEPYGLLVFGAADNHLHLVVCCSREEAGRLAQALATALRWRLGLPVRFFPARIRAVMDQRHLVSVFHYCLSQRNRHGVQSDPFLDASSLPELLGARVLATGCQQRVRELLPRVTRAGLLRHLGPSELVVASQLVSPLDAAAGALGLADLDERPREAVVARAALVQLVGNEIRSPALAPALTRSASFVRRLRSYPVPEPVAQALRLQLDIRAWLAVEHPEALEANPSRLSGR
jgi:hypothetical protein